MPKQSTPSGFARFIGGLFYLVVLSIALGAGTVFGWVHRSPLLGTILRYGIQPVSPITAFGGQHSVTFLILGCDEDRFYRGVKLHGHNIYKKYARADMILVTKIDFDQKTITGISVPRDTYLRLPGFVGHKINAYHEIAKKGMGSELEQRAVEYLLPGLHIDRVIVLDFNAFQKLVDAVGGVETNVDENMNYDDNSADLHVHLKKGPAHLNGYDAMCYVRFRHDPKGDIGRQARQKEFLIDFKRAIWQNPESLPEVANLSKQVLQNALSDSQIASLLFFVKDIPKSSIRLGMLPVHNGRGTFLVADQAQIPTILHEYGLLEHDGGTTP